MSIKTNIYFKVRDASQKVSGKMHFCSEARGRHRDGGEGDEEVLAILLFKFDRQTRLYVFVKFPITKGANTPEF